MGGIKAVTLRSCGLFFNTPRALAKKKGPGTAKSGSWPLRFTQSSEARSDRLLLRLTRFRSGTLASTIREALPILPHRVLESPATPSGVEPIPDPFFYILPILHLIVPDSKLSISYVLLR